MRRLLAALRRCWRRLARALAGRGPTSAPSWRWDTDRHAGWRPLRDDEQAAGWVDHDRHQAGRWLTRSRTP